MSKFDIISKLAQHTNLVKTSTLVSAAHEEASRQKSIVRANMVLECAHTEQHYDRNGNATFFVGTLDD